MNTPAQNQLDLELSANAAAAKAVGLTAYQVNEIKTKTFDTEGQNPLDWPHWSERFDNIRIYLSGLASQPTVAAKAATAAAAAAKPATA